jgi:uncharacterized protein
MNSGVPEPPPEPGSSPPRPEPLASLAPDAPLFAGEADLLPEQYESYPFWTYEDLILFAALFLPSLVLGGAVMAVLPRWLPLPNTVKLLIIQFVAYFFWFAALWLMLKTRYGRPFWKSLAWIAPRRGMPICAFGGPFLAVCISILGVLMRTPNVDTPMRELLSDPRSLLLVGTFAITLGPLCEELAFRGFMLPLLTRSFGTVVGIVLTAIPFGLLHGQQYGWLWQQVVLVTMAGVVFGWVRWYSGSTAASTMMHATYNLTFFVFYLIQTRMNHTW